MSDADNGSGEAGTEAEAAITETTEVKKTTEEAFDADRAMKTIQAQRENEKELQKRVRELEREQRDREGKEKTAEERIAALETKNSTADVRVAKQAVRAAATQAGAHYPGDIYALLDQSAIKFDDDGEPTNVDGLVEELKKSKPALFGTTAPGSADGGARGGGDGGKKPGMDDILRHAAGRS